MSAEADVAQSRPVAPSLDRDLLGRRLAETRALTLALKDPGSRPRRQRVPAELVVRDSTGPVAGSV